MEGTRSRLLKFVEHTRLGKGAFEREAGLSNGFLDKTTDRIRKGSLNMISSRFPELNMDWIINGRGEMIKDEEPPQGEDSGFTQSQQSFDAAHVKALIKHISEQAAQLSKAQDQLSVAQAQINKLLYIIEQMEKDK